MKTVFFLILFAFQMAQAHDHHAEELKAAKPLSDASVWQLNSSWKNQKSENRTLSDFAGKPRLVVMLFTRCQTACPLLVEDLKGIVNAAGKKGSDKFGVSIFSLDSFRESPASLSAFASKRQLPKDWELLTSDANAVAELAAALGVRYKRLASGDFIHSNVIYLLNSKGEVLAQKEGIKTPAADFVRQVKAALEKAD